VSSDPMKLKPIVSSFSVLLLHKFPRLFSY
jgi:hypothetical protein